MSTHTNRLLTHDPRSMAKARYDRLMSQQVTDERAPDRQFGIPGAIVIASALSVPIWVCIAFVIGTIFGGRL